MTMKSSVIVTTIVGLSLFLGACESKEVKKLPVKQELMVVKPTLESLDHRVTVLEEARARANAKAKAKFTPAPKYDPNYKG